MSDKMRQLWNLISLSSAGLFIIVSNVNGKHENNVVSFYRQRKLDDNKNILIEQMFHMQILDSCDSQQQK